MSMTIRSLLIQHMPFQALDELAELNAVLEPIEDRTGEIIHDHPSLVVRLVLWKGDHVNSVRYIEDVIEQEVYMPAIINAHPEHGGRNLNFVLALKAVVIDVLGKMAPLDSVKTSRDIRMPADLLRFDPLSKKTFGTVEEFERALRTKGRLGGYL